MTRKIHHLVFLNGVLNKPICQNGLFIPIITSEKWAINKYLKRTE